jgi:hypothetical protein
MCHLSYSRKVEVVAPIPRRRDLVCSRPYLLRAGILDAELCEASLDLLAGRALGVEL